MPAPPVIAQLHPVRWWGVRGPCHHDGIDRSIQESRNQARNNKTGCSRQQQRQSLAVAGRERRYDQRQKHGDPAEDWKNDVQGAYGVLLLCHVDVRIQPNWVVATGGFRLAAELLDQAPNDRCFQNPPFGIDLRIGQLHITSGRPRPAALANSV